MNLSVPPGRPSGPDENQPSIPPLLRISDRVTFLPIVNGSGQFAMTTRRWLLEHAFDCLAVPLPPSFQTDVETAVLDLPKPSIVIQRPSAPRRIPFLVTTAVPPGILKAKGKWLPTPKWARQAMYPSTRAKA